jgi:hypothetical protein
MKQTSRVWWVCVLIAVASACRGRSEAAAPANDPPKPAAPAIAMVVLVDGSLAWMGDADDPGNYDAAGKALDVLGSAPLPDARAELLTYGSGHGAEVRLPFGPLSALKASALGPRAQYSDHLTANLVDGIARARADLVAQPAPRKLLVIIGDGHDFDDHDDIGKAAAALRSASIETYTLFAASPDGISEPSPDNMRLLGGAGAYQTAAGDLAGQARAMTATLKAASPTAR